MSSPSPSESLLRGARLPAAWSLVAILVAVHIGSGVYLAWVGEPVVDSLFLDRALYLRAGVGGQLDVRLARGEWWRLWSSVLLHGDALHLLFNATSLWVLGRLLEPLVGAWRWLGWFTVGGVAASALSWALGVAQSDGASGGAFALLGATLVIGYRSRDVLLPDERHILGPVLWGLTGLNVVLSFVLPWIDPIGHLGGLAVGLLLGLLAYRPNGTPTASLRTWAWATVVLGAAVAGVTGWAGLW